MTDPNGLPSAHSFTDLWTRTVSQWLQADPHTSPYPPLTGRQRALLLEIRPEVLAGNYVIVSTSNRYLRDEIEANLRSVIVDVFSHELSQSIQLSVNVAAEDTPAADPAAQPSPSAEPSPSTPASPSAPAQTPATSPAQPAPPSHSVPTAPPAYTAPPATPAPLRDATREQRAEEHAREFEATTAHSAPTPPTQRTWAPISTPPFDSQNPVPEGMGMASAPGQGQVDDLVGAHGPLSNAAEQPPVTATGGPMMNQKYTFENFVTGSSNQMASAACRAVAEYPGNSYNPLLIWGESGLGKTHLLQAIGHYALELRPKLQIKYVSSEEMTNDFINSISTGRRDEFKRRYRSLDILIVDDIQFLQRKESTQEEFFHTFNALHQAGKQIVLSSDRPPRQLTTLEDRLRTRFESGLITDVQSPDLETRIAILEKKTSSMNVTLPDDVKIWMASRFEKSIRELDGALIRLTAYCQLGNVPVTLASAEEALRDLLPDAGDVEIIPALIIEVVSDYFGISPDEITGKTRARQIANARQIAMYLCRELTDLSLPKLGAAFGGRDHTTVMYAERRIHTKIQEDKKTFNQVQELTQRIKVRARD